MVAVFKFTKQEHKRKTNYLTTTFEDNNNSNNDKNDNKIVYLYMYSITITAYTILQRKTIDFRPACFYRAYRLSLLYDKQHHKQ